MIFFGLTWWIINEFKNLFSNMRFNVMFDTAVCVHNFFRTTWPAYIELF